MVLAGCGGDEPERELAPGVLRVGVVARAENERLIERGMRVAAAELNNGGGIDGVLRVAIVVERPRGNDYDSATRRLLAKRIGVLVLSCGQAQYRAAPIARRLGVLALAPCADRHARAPAALRTSVPADDSALVAAPIAGSELDEFYERYKALFGGRPSSSVPALGYDALKVLAAAAERAGTPNRAAVMRTVREGLEVGGAFGAIRYEDGSTQPRVDVTGARS